MFVHGLNGHQVDTWTHKDSKSPWPLELLSRDISGARIMAYGYDARVADWDEFLGKVSINKIDEHAQNFLEALSTDRLESGALQVMCFRRGICVCTAEY